MGADYEGQELAIEELRGLSATAKKYLCHHIGNSLGVVIGVIQLAKMEQRTLTPSGIPTTPNATSTPSLSTPHDLPTPPDLPLSGEEKNNGQ